MDSARWSVLRALFDRALSLEESERDAFLDEACGADDEMRSELRELLAQDQRGERAEPLGTRGEQAGSRAPAEIAGYRLERQIGAGGMGAVFLARQLGAGFERTVAIKLIHAGLDSAAILRRFAQERRVLAGLAHEGIARLYDAGTTSDGRPYLVMEHVDGQPIDAWCDAQRLDVRARIRLFLDVCAAVQHAHSSFVVHRDIKPSNILVTPEGRVKLLDFGIAKVLGPVGAESTAERTLTEQRMFTPAYASPEQIRGELVTTASDVYSLGVVLYELLTGRKPFATTTPASLFQRGDAPRPSVEVRTSGATAALRRTLPTQLARELAGDLDTILLKALTPEVGRRYATVAEFALDLQRHLSGLPVLARPDTWTYRARKFVRRHRVAVGASVLIALAVVAGLATSTVLYLRERAALEREATQRRIAERRFDSLRVLANKLVFDVRDALDPLPGAVAARELVVGLGLEYLDQLASERDVAGGQAADSALLAELAAGYRQLAQVSGDPDHASRGRIDVALEGLCRADELARAALAIDPTPAHRVLLARVRAARGRTLLASGDLGAARDELCAALTVFHAQAASLAFDEIGCLRALAVLGRASGDRRGARTALETALDTVEKNDASLIERDAWRARAGILDDLASLAYEEGDFASALQRDGECIDLVQGLRALSPNDIGLTIGLVVASNRASESAYALDRTDESIALAGASLAVARELVRADPNDAAALHLLADALDDLGQAHADARAFTQGEEELAEACALRRARAAAAPDDVRAALDLAGSLSRLLLVQLGQGRFEEGRASEAEAVATLRALLARASEPTTTRERIVRVEMRYAALLDQLIGVDAIARETRLRVARECVRACSDAHAELARLGAAAPAGLKSLTPELDGFAAHSAAAVRALEAP